jgi:hypothetical protein
LEVFRNGIKLGIADFTATNGTSFTLATGAVAGDLIEAVQFTGTTTPGGVTSLSTSTGLSASGPTGAVTLGLTGPYPINGSTSGTVTLNTVAVAGTNTATLPAATGTVMVSGNMPAFSVYKTAAQSISAGTLTKVQFETELFDTNNNFDSSTNYRFTPTVAGYYQLNFAINFVSSPAQLLISIYKNGIRGQGGEGQIIATLSGGTAINCSNVVYMNGSTDYLEGYAFSASANSFSTGANNTFFSGVLVRGA